MLMWAGSWSVPLRRVNSASPPGLTRFAFATNSHVRKLESEVVVSLVGADPKPVILAIPLSREGAVAATDLDGMDAALFLEA